jgi:CheY-like chemotaxis protein
MILLVEDDEQVRKTSANSLQELGYSVLQAANAADALSILQLHPDVDAMFTDIVMPNMNGRQLAELARKHKPELRVLYTTGYTRNAIVHQGTLDHDVAFLQKPFTIEQLAQKVRYVLDES